jgi:LPS-assembly protein
MNALPHYRGCLYLVLLLCALAGHAHAAEPECPPATPDLLAPSASDAPGTVHWSGCHMTVAANGDIELNGDVAVGIDDKELHCDHLSYLAATQELKMSGAVRLEGPTLRVIGDAGNYSASSAQLTHAQFELLQHPGRGEAQEVSTVQPDVFELHDVDYTTCPKGVADWMLRARKIILNTKTLRGVGEHTVVVFKGVPMLYLPWISFPLSSARQSGFLFPTLGSSSSSGAIVAVPWYWNIAPNQDLTATPTLYSRRGVDLGAEYRLLEHSGQGALRVNFLPNDQLADVNRSWQRLDAIDRLSEQWRVAANAQNVSDTHYFEDFGNGPQSSSTVFLPRDVRLTRRDDVWQLIAQVSNWQVLDGCSMTAPPGTCGGLSEEERPYTELPRLVAIGHWQGTSGFGSEVSSELVDFQRRTGPTGWRGWVQPGVEYNYVQPGFYVRPYAGWNLTAYDLQDAPTTDATPSRNMPILSLDSAMQLERITGSGSARLLTLEPRVKYVYIPYRDQSTLPVFDTDLPDPNFVSLFSDNRFVGPDRIGDANEVTMAVTTRMLEASTGQQYLSATIGQAVQFTQSRVTLPGEPLDTSKRSDLVADIDLTAYRHWNLHYDLAWNPQSSLTEKSLLSLQYLRSGTQVINLGYRFTRGTVDQADASAAWPVGRHWDVYARSVYSFLDKQWVDNFAGFQYHESCWGMRFVVRDAITNRTGTRQTSWYLQLELRGLSNVGSGADSFLHASIQGYSSE